MLIRCKTGRVSIVMELIPSTSEVHGAPDGLMTGEGAPMALTSKEGAASALAGDVARGSADAMTTADLTETDLATTNTSGAHSEPEIDNTELLGSLTQLDDLLADGTACSAISFDQS